MDRKLAIKGLRESTQPWQVLVVGGGATGVSLALDAATRGLRTALVERGDFGQGTSSRSTKLVHGGVRYLAQGNVRLVREALRERARLLKNAPHLVHARSFILPCRSFGQQLFYAIGLNSTTFWRVHPPTFTAPGGSPSRPASSARQHWSPPRCAAAFSTAMASSMTAAWSSISSRPPSATVPWRSTMPRCGA
jgi:hypothetical protein